MSILRRLTISRNAVNNNQYKQNFIRHGANSANHYPGKTHIQSPPANMNKKKSNKVSEDFKKHVKILGTEDGLRATYEPDPNERRKILSNIDKGGFIPKSKCCRKTNTPEKLLEQFDPRPSLQVQEKIDYFFIPYNFEYTVSKSMKFQNNKKE